MIAAISRAEVKKNGGRRALKWAALIVVATAIASLTFLFPRRPGSGPPPSGVPPATPSPAPLSPYKKPIAYEEASRAIQEAGAALPPELAGKTSADLAAAWPGWLRAHDAQIRARLERGDEDSIVNLWLYGTTFTARPRATREDLARLRVPSQAEDLLVGRLDDLVSSLAAPGANERLQFARQVVERHGIDLATPAGRDQARKYLVEARERTLVEMRRYERTVRSAAGHRDESSVFATLYRDRGLSSDTSIAIDFAVQQTMDAMRAKGLIAEGGVQRVAIVGPGLDFTDKAEGYDFYPLQTIQPFALIDALLRAGLARPDGLQTTTLDLNIRVNRHLEAARDRARAGESYTLQLPLAPDDPDHHWQPDLVQYWRQAGDRIGEEAPPLAPPPGAKGVRVRAVRIPARVVLAIQPRDLNIVVERLAMPADDERFDLIVATNVLVYYDAFDQALALSNIAAMLKPGGFFLTNYAVAPGSALERTPALATAAFWDRERNGDTLFWHRRR